MTRIFSATCVGSVVKIDGHIVTPTPTILSQGTESSSGIVFLNGNRSVYVAMNTTNIVTFLEQVASSLGTIATSLNALAAGIGQPPLIASTAANAALLTSTQTMLTALKGNLK